MGLDMYLDKRNYVKNWPHMSREARTDVRVEREGKPVAHIIPSRIKYVIEEVAYWRKANAIHNWFVQNVQDGEDDCKEYWVSREHLVELYDLCKRLLNELVVEEGQVANGYTYKDGKRVPAELISGRVIKNPELAEELLPSTAGFFFGETDYNEWYLQGLEETVRMLQPEIEGSFNDYIYQSSW